MSFFIFVRRIASFVKDKQTLKLPAKAIISVRLRPDDLMQEISLVTQQTRIPWKDPNPQITAKMDMGSGEVHWSTVFRLPDLHLSTQIDDLTILIEKNWVHVNFKCKDDEHFSKVVSWIEFILVPTLAVTLLVPMQIEEMKFEIEDIKGLLEFEWLQIPINGCLRKEDRDRLFLEALSASAANVTTYDRLNQAVIYFRQAIRFLCPNECRLPFLNQAEAILNLAKVLEVLFGDRDGIRLGSRAIGLSSQEIEHQLIPISIARNSLDIAHAGVEDLSTEQVSMLHSFCQRAVLNVQSLLLRLFQTEASVLSRVLRPLPSGSSERQKFIQLLEEYCTEPRIASSQPV